MPTNAEPDIARKLEQQSGFQIRKKKTCTDISHSLPLNAEPDRSRKLGQQTRFQIRNKTHTYTHIYHIFHALPSNAEPDRARELGQQARFLVNSQTAKSRWLSGEKHQVPNYVKRGEEV